MEFKAFNKIPRLSREMVITEKIDGTNGIIAIGEDGQFQAGSRTRWLLSETGEQINENAGFALWALEHREELMQLGVGYHYGEWWGKGIQRGYGLDEKRFSLFNVGRWSDDAIRPKCCGVVPVLFRGLFDSATIASTLKALEIGGSVAAPGFMKPEGIVIYHVAGGHLFKKTIEKDESPKGNQE